MSRAASPTPSAGTDSPRAVAWAGALNLVGGAVGAVVALLLTVAVSRELGVSGAGSYFAGVAVLTVLAGVGELGTDTALVRFVAAARAEQRLAEVRRLVGWALTPVLLVGAVSLLAAGLLAPWVLPGRPVVTALALIGGTVALSLTAVLLAVGRGLGDAVTYPLVWNLCAPLTRLAAVVLALELGAGADGALLAWALASLVPCLAAARSARRWVVRASAAESAPSSPRAPQLTAWRRFCAARGTAAAVEVLLEWADVLLVWLLASPEAAGVYAVVTRCVRVGDIVHQANRVAVSPALAAALARGDHPGARRLHAASAVLMIALAWPFYAVLAGFGDAVLAVFGAEFAGGWPALAMLAGALAVAAGAGAVQSVVLMGGRGRWQLQNKTGALALDVVLCLALVPLWGVSGAALAWSLTIVAETAVVTVQARRILGVPDRADVGASEVGGRVARLAVGVLVASLAAVAVARMLPIPGIAGALAAGTLALAAGCALAWRQRDLAQAAPAVSTSRASSLRRATQ